MMHLSITNSQRMALLDLLLEYARMPEATQMFVDCSTDAGIETSVGDLLTLLTEAGQVPTVNMQMLIDVGLNGFALELMAESLAGKKNIHTFNPLRFEFRGVIWTLEPAKAAEPAPEVTP